MEVLTCRRQNRGNAYFMIHGLTFFPAFPHASRKNLFTDFQTLMGLPTLPGLKIPKKNGPHPREPSFMDDTFNPIEVVLSPVSGNLQPCRLHKGPAGYSSSSCPDLYSFRPA